MASRLPILMYHAVHPDRSLISTAPFDFERQIRWLYDQGYRTLPLSGFVDHLRSKTPFPERTVVITFDDGFESLYTYAVPVLKACGFTATIFLVADYCGEKNNWPGQPQGIPEFPLLTWEQIREMDHLGFEFGAHSASHPRLDQLTTEQLKYEVSASKKTIEKHLGHEVETFAYPYGQYNQGVLRVVEDAFRGACSTKSGFAGFDSHPFEIERVDINYLNHSWLFPWINSPFASSYIKGRGVLRYLAGKVLNRTWQ